MDGLLLFSSAPIRRLENAALFNGIIAADFLGRLLQ